MKKIRNESYRAITHVFGDHLSLVILLLIAIGWFGDTLLALYLDVIYYFFPSKMAQYIAVLPPSSLILLSIFCLARQRKTSDRYSLNEIDSDRLRKHTLILVLSPYKDYSKENKSVEAFEAKISELPQVNNLHELTNTAFNCNWLPQLHAIEHYENLKEVIVIVTKDLGNRKGSIGQTHIFKALADKYFSQKNREITISSHIKSNYLQGKKDLVMKNEHGAPIDNLKDFGDTVLELIDQIESKNAKVNDRRKQIAVDVTGGYAWMSAVMAAATSSQDIFIHYSEITETEIRSLEIDVSVR